MLKVRTPERGSRESWLHHADAYAEASRSIVAAAAARNYMLTQRALEQLTRACSACHIDHR
jgi:hypothetical protein